jgi:hypothetical protein
VPRSWCWPREELCTYSPARATPLARSTEGARRTRQRRLAPGRPPAQAAARVASQPIPRMSVARESQVPPARQAMPARGGTGSHTRAGRASRRAQVEARRNPQGTRRPRTGAGTWPRRMPHCMAAAPPTGIRGPSQLGTAPGLTDRTQIRSPRAGRVPALAHDRKARPPSLVRRPPAAATGKGKPTPTAAADQKQASPPPKAPLPPRLLHALRTDVEQRAAPRDGGLQGSCGALKGAHRKIGPRIGPDLRRTHAS